MAAAGSRLLGRVRGGAPKILVEFARAGGPGDRRLGLAKIGVRGRIRCAAGFAGIYDLRGLARDDGIVMSQLWRGQVRTAVGEAEEELAAASPSRNADKLKAKVLLIHGAEDRRAPLSHAEALRDALAKEGRPPEWHVEPREGHGFYDEAARERMYTRLVAFLREHTAPAKPAP